MASDYGEKQKLRAPLLIVDEKIEGQNYSFTKLIEVP